MTKITEWFSWECVTGRHYECKEGEDWNACDCQCHPMGYDDLTVPLDPPIEDEEQ